MLDFLFEVIDKYKAIRGSPTSQPQKLQPEEMDLMNSEGFINQVVAREIRMIWSPLDLVFVKMFEYTLLPTLAVQAALTPLFTMGSSLQLSVAGHRYLYTKAADRNTKAMVLAEKAVTPAVRKQLELMIKVLHSR